MSENVELMRVTTLSPALAESAAGFTRDAGGPVATEAGRPDDATAAVPESDGPSRDENRRLVQRLLLSPGSEGRHVILFSTVDRVDDAAALCAGAAEALAANTDGSVCVVDADLRRPSLHGHFGATVDRGLADVLRDGCAALDVARQVRANLWFVSAGSAPDDPETLFGFDRTRAVLQELRETWKYVLVHAPPLGDFSEPMLLGRWTDGVVLVVEAHRTRRQRARRVRDNLEIAGVPLLGVVLANRQYPIPDALYHHL